MPRVSIVIPVYNKAKYIAEAIDSALNQTFKDIEIIIVNDSSTDNSAEIIKQYTDKYSNIVFYENEENKGVIRTRNLAIEKATGKYILPLDADDILEPTYIEKAVKILEDNPSIGIVYCRAKLFGTQSGEWKLSDYNKTEFLFENCIFATSLFRKADFVKVGGYKECMENCSEDYELWLSIIETGLEPYRIDEFLFNYRKCEEATVTDAVQKSGMKTFQQMVKNHPKSYADNIEFIDAMITNFHKVNNHKAIYSNLEKEIAKLKKKRKKYLTLFKIFLFISIIELIIILINVWRIG